MAAHSQLVADAMLEGQIADIWPDYSRNPVREQYLHMLLAFGAVQSKALSRSFCLRLSNVFAFFAVIKETAKSLHRLTSSSLVASISHVQWSLNIVLMRIRVIS